ncbi:hypothetical protein [Nocardiopsis ganjiahuensis]|uniref:hypothetical protein n=1 Tax=Nocardiopsis ganjiahuensis TaxID=239984 RepID=UPI0012692552|nr:hypothetical protein [Nocardiopsis ganjiahuensis]
MSKVRVPGLDVRLPALDEENRGDHGPRHGDDQAAPLAIGEERNKAHSGKGDLYYQGDRQRDVQPFTWRLMPHLLRAPALWLWVWR